MTFAQKNSGGKMETWRIVLNVEANIGRFTLDEDGITNTKFVIETFNPEKTKEVADFLINSETFVDEENVITFDDCTFYQWLYEHFSEKYQNIKPGESGFNQIKITINKLYLERERVENLLERFRSTKCEQDAVRRIKEPEKKPTTDYRASIPCRNIQQGKSCPFRNKCYYKH